MAVPPLSALPWLQVYHQDSKQLQYFVQILVAYARQLGHSVELDIARSIEEFETANPELLEQVNRMALHRTASDGTASHCIGWHCIALPTCAHHITHQVATALHICMACCSQHADSHARRNSCPMVLVPYGTGALW